MGVQLVKALLPLIVAADPAARPAVVDELKAVLRGYLAPIEGVAAPASGGESPVPRQ